MRKWPPVGHRVHKKTKEQRASGHACTRRLASGDLGEELDPALPGWDQNAVGEVLVGKRGVGRSASFEVSAFRYTCPSLE